MERCAHAAYMWGKGAHDQQEGHDPVHSPTHYNAFGIECIDAIEASMTPEEFKGMLKGNAEKYIWRYRYKGKPLQDLQKGRWYLDKLIEKVQEDG
jgi:hypothetical protein